MNAYDARRPPRRGPLWRLWNVLDPVDYLLELTAALAAMLTIVLTAASYTDEVDDPAQMLLVVALGCSLGGGLSSGLLWVLEDLSRDAGRRDFDARLRAAEQSAIDQARARVELASYGRLEPEEVARIVDALATRGGDRPLPLVDLDRSNLRVTAACVLYNTTALVLASIPFVFVSDWQLALRVSNVVILAMLFIVGFRWGKRLHANPWRSGLALLVLGLLLVSVSLAMPAL